MERLASPEVIADPYPYYAALRPSSPVFGYTDWPPGTVPGQDPPVRAWALFGYEEVAAAARDHATFSSAAFQGESSAPTLMLVNQDEPEHGPLRKLVSKAFTPRRVAALRPVVRAIADELIAQLPEGDDFDVVETLASELPTRVMMAMLGLPDESCADLKRWSNAFMLSAALEPAERVRSNAELAEYFRAFVAERSRRRARGERGPDDLVEALLDAEVEGRKLDESEIWRFCFTLVVAGSETTTYFATNVVDSLLRRPELFARLRRERELLPRLLDEVLRLSGPAQRLFRVATRDVRVGDAEIRRGDWVALFYAAANHDPREFPEPTELRLDRPNAGRHLTFGLGVHYCLGGPLALLEVEVLADALLDHFQTLTRGAAPRVPQTATLLQHSAVSLPARGARSARGIEERNLATVRRVFARFGAGDIPGILELLDPDVRIEFYGPSEVPYAGFYDGREQARRFFETVLSRVEIARFEPQEFIARGDKVVVTGALELYALPSRRAIVSDFVHVITLRDGRWLRFRDFMNTAAAQSAFSVGAAAG